jgi:hypothetical protein
MPPDSPTHRNPSARGRKRLHCLWIVGAGLVGLGVVATLAFLGSGPSWLELESPKVGEVVGTRGLEVVVRFPEIERVAPETFRVLLNGADVTEAFTTGENGAYGRLFALLDGENVLRIEVFATPSWPPGLFLEYDREARIVHRRPLDVDRG